MPRYASLNPAEMSPAQKSVVDEIVSGKRGRFGGPFELLIRSPEVCRHLSRLGEYLRWGSSLSPALSELAICLTARHIRANYEWHAHAPLAVEGGVPAAALEAIRTGGTPHFDDDAEWLMILLSIVEVTQFSNWPDAPKKLQVERFARWMAKLFGSGKGCAWVIEDLRFKHANRSHPLQPFRQEMEVRGIRLRTPSSVLGTWSHD